MKFRDYKLSTGPIKVGQIRRINLHPYIILAKIISIEGESSLIKVLRGDFIRRRDLLGEETWVFVDRII